MDVFVKVDGATRKYSVDTADHAEARREVAITVLAESSAVKAGVPLALVADNTKLVLAA